CPVYFPDSHTGTAEKLDDEQARKLVEPCGKCTNCQEIARSASMAVWEIDGASNNSVENVRELIESLRTAPPPGSHYKIYIIDEVHMLSVAAFNALLKSLEEPPPDTIFVFATTEPHRIPETVISRCQRHDFRRLTNEVIAGRLAEIACEEGIEVEEAVFSFIARAAQGGMRDAQSMFDRLIAFCAKKIDLASAQQIFGVVDRQCMARLSAGIIQGQPVRCFELLDEAFKHSIDLRLFVADFVRHWRNILLLALLQNDAPRGAGVPKFLELTPQEYNELREQAAALSPFDAQRLFDIAERTAELALHSSFSRFVLEAGIAKMAALPSLEPLPDILEKLGKLSGASGPGGTRQSNLRPSNPKTGKTIEDSSRALERACAVGEAAPGALATEVHIEEKEQWFNPSWPSFLVHVKSRGEMLLEALLRRVSPAVFTPGKLVLEAAPFDLAALSEMDSQRNLINCLYSYTGAEKWDVRFVKHDAASVSVNDTSEDPARRAAPDSTARTAGAVPGSVAALESQARRERKSEVEQEARADPLVRAALSAFKGSKIEKISILDS
ncbi:MAG TPA: DNA polymerase III subunit gamma/tau, partial [Oligoflexia bacterium]|nr:DNA polymerase III subunit gamma/tau [Oligoflexia bacterium]